MIEERKSSLVELTTLEQIVNMCRILRDEIEALEEMLTIYGTLHDADLYKLYERVRSTKNRGEELKVLLLEYLVRSSEIIMYSVNYVNIVKTIDRAIQQLDGAAYRVLLAKENKIILSDETIEILKKLLELEKKQVQHLENSATKLTVSPKSSLEELNSVFKLEEEIDVMFRKELIDIYNRYSGYITALLILKDIIEHIEDSSDLIKTAGEEVRYLALVRLAI
jgi:uncharacterized protein Yka (UPF0111/DUF47 family)